MLRLRRSAAARRDRLSQFEADHLLKRQAQNATDRTQRAEGWTPPASEEVAQRALVNMGLASELTDESTHAGCAPDRSSQRRPTRTQTTSSRPARATPYTAMRCRLLAYKSNGRHGVTRSVHELERLLASSVSGLGPPPSSCSLAASARVPRRGDSLASVAFGDMQVLLQSVARRIARLNARTG